VTEPVDKSRKKTSRKTKFLGGGIALLVVGAAIVITVVATARNNIQTPPKGVVNIKVTPSPINKPTNTGTDLTTEIVNIPIGADKEELTNDLVQILNIQYDGNLNQKTVDVILNNIGTTPVELSRQIATQHMKASFDGQYISSWRQDTNLSVFFDYMVERNAERIQGFTRGQSLVESQTLISSSFIRRGPTEVVISVITVDRYNDPNDPANTTKINGVTGTQEFTLVPQGDHLVIAKQVVTA
jgi:hypothetical protein